MNPTIVGQGFVGRVLCDIVSFWVPDLETTYRLWIGAQDQLVHRQLLEKSVGSELLTYSRFNQPLRITAP